MKKITRRSLALLLVVFMLIPSFAFVTNAATTYYEDAEALIADINIYEYVEEPATIKAYFDTQLELIQADIEVGQTGKAYYENLVSYIAGLTPYINTVKATLDLYFEDIAGENTGSNKYGAAAATKVYNIYTTAAAALESATFEGNEQTSDKKPNPNYYVTLRATLTQKVETAKADMLKVLCITVGSNPNCLGSKTRDAAVEELLGVGKTVADITTIDDLGTGKLKTLFAYYKGVYESADYNLTNYFNARANAALANALTAINDKTTYVTTDDFVQIEKNAAQMMFSKISEKLVADAKKIYTDTDKQISVWVKKTDTAYETLLEKPAKPADYTEIKVRSISDLFDSKQIEIDGKKVSAAMSSVVAAISTKTTGWNGTEDTAITTGWATIKNAIEVALNATKYADADIQNLAKIFYAQSKASDAAAAAAYVNPDNAGEAAPSKTKYTKTVTINDAIYTQEFVKGTSGDKSNVFTITAVNGAADIKDIKNITIACGISITDKYVSTTDCPSYTVLIPVVKDLTEVTVDGKKVSLLTSKGKLNADLFDSADATATKTKGTEKLKITVFVDELTINDCYEIKAGSETIYLKHSNAKINQAYAYGLEEFENALFGETPDATRAAAVAHRTVMLIEAIDYTALVDGDKKNPISGLEAAMLEGTAYKSELAQLIAGTAASRTDAYTLVKTYIGFFPTVAEIKALKDLVANDYAQIKYFQVNYADAAFAGRDKKATAKLAAGLFLEEVAKDATSKVYVYENDLTDVEAAYNALVAYIDTIKTANDLDKANGYAKVKANKAGVAFEAFTKTNTTGGKRIYVSAIVTEKIIQAKIKAAGYNVEPEYEVVKTKVAEVLTVDSYTGQTIYKTNDKGEIIYKDVDKTVFFDTETKLVVTASNKNTVTLTEYKQVNPFYYYLYGVPATDGRVGDKYVDPNPAVIAEGLKAYTDLNGIGEYAVITGVGGVIKSDDGTEQLCYERAYKVIARLSAIAAAINGAAAIKNADAKAINVADFTAKITDAIKHGPTESTKILTDVPEIKVVGDYPTYVYDEKGNQKFAEITLATITGYDDLVPSSGEAVNVVKVKLATLNNAYEKYVAGVIGNVEGSANESCESYRDTVIAFLKAELIDEVTKEDGKFYNQYYSADRAKFVEIVNYYIDAINAIPLNQKLAAYKADVQDELYYLDDDIFWSYGKLIHTIEEHNNLLTNGITLVYDKEDKEWELTWNRIDTEYRIDETDLKVYFNDEGFYPVTLDEPSEIGDFVRDIQANWADFIYDELFAMSEAFQKAVELVESSEYTLDEKNIYTYEVGAYTLKEIVFNCGYGDTYGNLAVVVYTLADGSQIMSTVLLEGWGSDTCGGYFAVQEIKNVASVEIFLFNGTNCVGAIDATELGLVK